MKIKHLKFKLDPTWTLTYPCWLTLSVYGLMQEAFKKLKLQQHFNAQPKPVSITDKTLQVPSFLQV